MPNPQAVPNREHANEVESLTRRSMDMLSALIDEARVLRVKLGKGDQTVGGSDARQLAERAMRLTEKLAMLEAHRHTREWHAVDVAEQDK